MQTNKVTGMVKPNTAAVDAVGAQPETKRVVFDVPQFDAMQRELRHFPNALIVYFNRNCQGCHLARNTWISKGLPRCSNVFFVEFNDDTQRVLGHVTHIPSYEHLHNGSRVNWATTLPANVHTVQAPDTTLVCHVEEGDV